MGMVGWQWDKALTLDRFDARNELDPESLEKYTRKEDKEIVLEEDEVDRLLHYEFVDVLLVLAPTPQEIQRPASLHGNWSLGRSLYSIQSPQD